MPPEEGPRSAAPPPPPRGALSCALWRLDLWKKTLCRQQTSLPRGDLFVEASTRPTSWGPAPAAEGSEMATAAGLLWLTVWRDERERGTNKPGLGCFLLESLDFCHMTREGGLSQHKHTLSKTRRGGRAPSSPGPVHIIPPRTENQVVVSSHPPFTSPLPPSSLNPAASSEWGAEGMRKPRNYADVSD